jgi:hypothetical protein
MKDGLREVRCHIATDTLVNFGKTADLSGAPLIFAAYIELIERAASEKYDRTTRVDYEILTITADDLL